MSVDSEYQQSITICSHSLSVITVKFLFHFSQFLSVSSNIIKLMMIFLPQAGALKLEECVRAGVPPGPLLGDLKKGMDITLADGTLVKAADVTEPDDPGPVFIGMFSK